VLLAHGLAKAALFLLAPRWPSRDLLGWRDRPLPLTALLPLWIASLSICGLPPLLGWISKDAVSAASAPGPSLLVSVLSVGTVAVYARLWGTPLAEADGSSPSWSPAVLMLVIVLLVGGLLGAIGTPLMPAFGKAGLTLLLGLLLERILDRLRRADSPGWPERPRLPDVERFTDLVGGMGLVGAGLLVVLNR
jgi:multicomponent Na+:H+ antiporter subunit D